LKGRRVLSGRRETMNIYKPMVYICSPYAGDIEGNTQKAKRYCRMAADHDCIPIAPHLYFPQFMSEETERDEALYNGLILLSKCDEIWICGERISAGMQLEMKQAACWHKKICYIKGEEDITCR
jgi:hypothetical protein